MHTSAYPEYGQGGALQYLGRTERYDPAWAFDLTDDFARRSGGATTADAARVPAAASVSAVSAPAMTEAAPVSTGRDNPAHNAADFQRLKESLAEQERTLGPERGPAPPEAVTWGGGGNRYHSIYDDETRVREGEPPPRLGAARPDPDAVGPHTRLRWDPDAPSRGGEGLGRVYQGREFDTAGHPVRDIDFTSPTYPNGGVRPDHVPPPHEHPYLPNDPNNPRAGYKRSTEGIPYTWEREP